MVATKFTVRDRDADRFGDRNIEWIRILASLDDAYGPAIRTGNGVECRRRQFGGSIVEELRIDDIQRLPGVLQREVNGPSATGDAMVDSYRVQDKAVLGEDRASGVPGREAARIREVETADQHQIIGPVDRWTGRIGREDRENAIGGVAVDREVVRARTV